MTEIVSVWSAALLQHDCPRVLASFLQAQQPQALTVVLRLTETQPPLIDRVTSSQREFVFGQLHKMRQQPQALTVVKKRIQSLLQDDDEQLTHPAHACGARITSEATILTKSENHPSNRTKSEPTSEHACQKKQRTRWSPNTLGTHGNPNHV